ENETNAERLFEAPNRTPYVKDAFHEAIVHGHVGAVNPAQVGTRAAAHYQFTVAPAATETIRLRLSPEDPTPRLSLRRGEAETLCLLPIPAQEPQGGS